MLDKNKKYYYKFTITECVLCGRGETTKERIYKDKPKDKSECYEFLQFACSEHFM